MAKRVSLQSPIGYEGSKWNLLEYVNGKPFTLVDPYGKECIAPFDCWATWGCAIAIANYTANGAMAALCCAACTVDPEPISTGGVCACCAGFVLGAGAAMVSVVPLCNCPAPGAPPSWVDPKIKKMQDDIEKLQKQMEEVQKRLTF